MWNDRARLCFSPHDPVEPIEPGPSARSLAQSSDVELVERGRGGEERALEILIQRYTPMLVGYFFARVKDYDETEDLVQEVLITACRGLAGLRRADRFGPWVLTIARNKLRDHFRRLKVQPRIERIPGGNAEPAEALWSQVADARPDPSREAATAERRARVLDAIRGMSDKYRVILYLRLIDDASHREIAQRLGLKESTVRMRLMRGLKRLRAGLTKQGVLSRDEIEK